MAAGKNPLTLLSTNLVMKNAELMPLVGSNTQVKRLADDGEMVSLGSGYYAHPSVDLFLAYVLVAAKYYPDAVISNITALLIHKLSDERIDSIDVDIPRNRSIRNRILIAHRVAKSHLIGITTKDYMGHKIRIYDIERSLCDAYKIDPEGHIFYKALKRYVAAGKIQIELVRQYDEALKTKVWRALTQELADG